MAWSRRVRVSPTVPDDVARVADLEAGLDLRAALANLASRQRAAVVLRYYFDLSADQTAAILGCSAGNVKSQTACDLDALRRLCHFTHGDPSERRQLIMRDISLLRERLEEIGSEAANCRSTSDVPAHAARLIATASFG